MSEKIDGNDPIYRTDKKCIETDCEEIAGTVWSSFWCPSCNKKRMDKISQSLKEIDEILARKRNKN